MKNIFAFLFLFLSILVNAQVGSAPAEMSWGPEIAEPSGSYLSKVIYADGEGFTTLRRKNAKRLIGKERIWVERYSNKMRLLRSEELDLKYKKKTRRFENAITIGGKLWFLTSYNNMAKKKNYLFAQQLNNRLQPNNELLLIGEVNAGNAKKERLFDTHISRDSSKLLVYSQLPYKRKTPENFAFKVFNDNMDKLWEKDVVLPYNDDIFLVRGYRIDNKGNVYVIGQLFDKPASRFSRLGIPRKGSYKYIVLAYTQNGERSKEYEIALQDKLITDLTLRVADNGNLVLAGFYSEQSSNKAKGTCYLRIDAESEEVLQRSVKKLDFEFLTEDMSDGAIRRAQRAERNGNRKKEAELVNYDLDDLVLRSDGGAVLVAEQYYIEQVTTTTTSNGTSSSSTTYYYNYNDIIIVNIRPDGQIEWSARIPKRQETSNDRGYFSSYSKAVTSGKLYFVYNDNPRNLDADSENKKRVYNFNGKRSVIVLAEVDMKGNVLRFPLQSNRELGVLARPKVAKQTSKNNMIMCAEKGRNYRFGRILFK